MKAGILTFHRAGNFGALLQAYALCRTLLEKGIEAEVIDYRCPAIESAYTYGLLPARLRPNPLKWKAQFRNLKRKKREKESCARFREQHLPLSRPYVSDAERAGLEDTYALILTGSDQIWNPAHTGGKNDWYAFRRSGKNSVVASYAASVGGLHSFRYYYRFYRDDLAAYDLLSVREGNARAFLEKDLMRPVRQLPDPVFLLAADRWEALAEPSPLEGGPYLLYFDVSSNEEACRIARRAAGEKQLRLVHFSGSLPDSDRTPFASDTGPCQFLSLIRHAEAVVTSSFHAAAFSVLFEKPFLAVPHPRTGDRVRELLAGLGLSGRIAEKDGAGIPAQLDLPAGYPSVRPVLEQMRADSESYLDSCIRYARQLEKNRTEKERP